MITESMQAELLAAIAYIQGIANRFYSANDAQELVSIAKENIVVRYNASKGASLKTFAVQMYQQARQELKRVRLGLSVSYPTLCNRMAAGRGDELDALVGDSLDRCVGTNGDDEAEVIEGVSDVCQQSPSELACLFDDCSTVRDAMAGLPERTQAILRLHLIEGQTLEQVGATLGIVAERVRQIEEAALAKLKKQLQK